MTRSAIMVVAAAALVASTVAGVLLLRGGASEPAVAAAPARSEMAWSEVAWPFPIDQFGKGKAFRCQSSDCGTEVNLYIRAKIGFCNCTTGVADDDELARISDFALFDARIAALGPGQPIAVAWMNGRSRAFAVGGAAPARSLLSVGFNDRCDAIVATAVIGHERPGAIQPAVLAFLNSHTVLRWAEVTLGL
jgi:hypothetical protein